MMMPSSFVKSRTDPKNPGCSCVMFASCCTSAGLWGMDPAMPFSLVMLFELLLGELGPEPGALLHADSERTTELKLKEIVSVKTALISDQWNIRQHLVIH